jgi:hypothetical protein
MAMTLIGLLSDYPLPELLFDLGTRGRSGSLTLCSDEHEIEITLVKGGIAAASSTDIRHRLGQRLVMSGDITKEQLDDILSRQRECPQKTTGELLVESGYVTEADVKRALSLQISELVYRILTHDWSYFSFRRECVASSRIPVDISLEHAVFRAISRADEWTRHHLESGRIEIADDITADMIESSIIDGWPVIEALLDGAATFDEIVSIAGIPRDDARAAIRVLNGSGAVRILAS